MSQIDFSPEEVIAIQADFQDLLDKAYRSKSLEDQAFLKKAFDVAYAAHYPVRRKTGEAYIHHPIEVARIAALEMGLDTLSVTCALLHDVVEDSPEYSLEDMDRIFGKEVAAVVDGLTKISDVYDASLNLQTETFRKLLMTIPESIRVIFIKIADRLHNMRTMHGMPPHKQKIKAGETLHVYAPIAHLLGLFDVKKELEDLSFKYYYPHEYARLIDIIEEFRTKKDALMTKFEIPMSKRLSAQHIPYKLKRTTKSLYATWRKMINREISFDELHNFFSLQIIISPFPDFSERDQCYLIYSKITEVYLPRAESLRDWILKPLPNGFKALLIDVMADYGEWVEVQILTDNMHQISRYGTYTDKPDTVSIENNEWIRKMNDTLQTPLSSTSEMLEMVRMDLYNTEMYVFTPKGKIITMPKGATVLDFAFYVHSELGLHCVAAKVNQRTVERKYKLKTADQVDIIVSESAWPDKEWIEAVSTSRAKSSLKEYFKKQIKKQIEEGYILFKEIVRNLSKEDPDELIVQVIQFCECSSSDELFEKLATRSITPNQVIHAVKPRSQSPWTSILNWTRFSQNKETEEESEQWEFSVKEPLVISEYNDEQLYTLAPCCNPIPGDDTIAYLSAQDMVIVHQRKCSITNRLYAEESKKVTDVKWQPHKIKQFRARLKLKGIDRKGLLNDITNLVYEQYQINMAEVNFKTSDTVFEGTIDVYVHDSADLTKLKNQLTKIRSITHVNRMDKF